MTLAIAQREAALARAHQVRMARFADRELVRSQPDYASGLNALAELLDQPREHLASMFVLDLLSWVKRSQPVIRQRWLQAAGISDLATVGRLTYRQRAALVEQIDTRVR